MYQFSRILSLPKSIKETLIEKYFDEHDVALETTKNDEVNKSCLICIQLGENKAKK